MTPGGGVLELAVGSRDTFFSNHTVHHTLHHSTHHSCGRVVLLLLLLLLLRPPTHVFLNGPFLDSPLALGALGRRARGSNAPPPRLHILRAVDNNNDNMVGCGQWISKAQPPVPVLVNVESNRRFFPRFMPRGRRGGWIWPGPLTPCAEWAPLGKALRRKGANPDGTLFLFSALPRRIFWDPQKWIPSCSPPQGR